MVSWDAWLLAAWVMHTEPGAGCCIACCWQFLLCTHAQHKNAKQRVLAGKQSLLIIEHAVVSHHAAADNDLQHKLGKILQFLEEGYR